MVFVTRLLATLSSLLIVSAYPSGAGQLSKRDLTVTSENLANFKLFAQYSAAALCNADGPGPLKCPRGACPQVEAAGATSIAEFIDPVTDMRGFVAVDPSNKLIVVAFPGSDSIRNYLADVLFLYAPCEFEIGCLAHAGFLASWKSVHDDVEIAVKSAKAANPSFKLVVTGHSLGGAVATLTGAKLRQDGYALDIYTYGSPRVGNAVFANFVTTQAGSEFRITHFNDPVPKLAPILLGYRHTSPEYWLSNGNATTLDYGIEDIKICEGIANVSCNAGTGGFEIASHVNYLVVINACETKPIQWRSLETEARYASLVMYDKLDIEYAGALDAKDFVPLLS